MLDESSATGTVWLNASIAEASADPYPHLIAAPALETTQADALLTWLEMSSHWRLNDGGFYAALECDLAQRNPPPQIVDLFSKATLSVLEQQATAMFREPLVLSGAIAAHRMDAGHGIGIHADTPHPNEETHRLIIVLTRRQQPGSGGHFVLLAGREAASARRFVPMAHNLAIAFPLTEKSYHAVTTLQSGQRFSVVFSFRPKTQAGV